MLYQQYLYPILTALTNITMYFQKTLQIGQYTSVLLIYVEQSEEIADAILKSIHINNSLVNWSIIKYIESSLCSTAINDYSLIISLWDSPLHVNELLQLYQQSVIPKNIPHISFVQNVIESDVEEHLKYILKNSSGSLIFLFVCKQMVIMQRDYYNESLIFSKNDMRNDNLFIEKRDNMHNTTIFMPFILNPPEIFFISQQIGSSELLALGGTIPFFAELIVKEFQTNVVFLTKKLSETPGLDESKKQFCQNYLEKIYVVKKLPPIPLKLSWV